jgi:hypothetical protein
MCFRLVILFSLMLIGCNSQDGLDQFELATQKRWVAATKLSWISPHFKQGEAIKEPAGSWQALFQVSFIDQEFHEVSDCVIYKIPTQNEFGILKVVANPANKNCLEFLHEKPYVQKESIVNLGHEYFPNLGSAKNLILKIDQLRFEYEFLNLKSTEKITDILSHSRSQYKTPHFMITSEISYRANTFVPKVASKCLVLNDDCEVKEDHCDMCEKGSFPVVATACPKTYERLCGPDACGEKDQPACIRGYMSSGIDPSLYCINDSPVGFCSVGLQVVCMNGMLMCQ